MPDKRVDALNSLNKNDYNSKYITLSDNTKIGVDLIKDLIKYFQLEFKNKYRYNYRRWVKEDISDDAIYNSGDHNSEDHNSGDPNDKDNIIYTIIQGEGDDEIAINKLIKYISNIYNEKPNDSDDIEIPEKIFNSDIALRKNYRDSSINEGYIPIIKITSNDATVVYFKPLLEYNYTNYDFQEKSQIYDDLNKLNSIFKKSNYSDLDNLVILDFYKDFTKKVEKLKDDIISGDDDIKYDLIDNIYDKLSIIYELKIGRNNKIIKKSIKEIIGTNKTPKEICSISESENGSTIFNKILCEINKRAQIFNNLTTLKKGGNKETKGGTAAEIKQITDKLLSSVSDDTKSRYQTYLEIDKNILEMFINDKKFKDHITNLQNSKSLSKVADFTKKFFQKSPKKINSKIDLKTITFETFDKFIEKIKDRMIEDSYRYLAIIKSLNIIKNTSVEDMNILVGGQKENAGNIRNQGNQQQGIGDKMSENSGKEYFKNLTDIYINLAKEYGKFTNDEKESKRLIKSVIKSKDDTGDAAASTETDNDEVTKVAVFTSIIESHQTALGEITRNIQKITEHSKSPAHNSNTDMGNDILRITNLKTKYDIEINKLSEIKNNYKEIDTEKKNNIQEIEKEFDTLSKTLLEQESEINSLIKNFRHKFNFGANELKSEETKKKLYDLQNQNSENEKKSKDLEERKKQLTASLKVTKEELKKLYKACIDINLPYATEYNDFVKYIIKVGQLKYIIDDNPQINNNNDIIEVYNKEIYRIDKELGDIKIDISSNSKKINDIKDVVGADNRKASNISRSNQQQNQPYYDADGGGIKEDEKEKGRLKKLLDGNLYKLIRDDDHKNNNLFAFIEELKPLFDSDDDNAVGSNNASGKKYSENETLYEQIWNEYNDGVKAYYNNEKGKNPLTYINEGEKLKNKLILYDLDPEIVLKITFQDKVVFLGLMFLIRTIIMVLFEFLIDYNLIKSLRYAILIYATLYILILLLFIVFINLDSYKLRIVFNYLNMHINTPGIILHVMLFIIFSLLVIIIIQTDNFVNNLGDILDYTYIYNYIYTFNFDNILSGEFENNITKEEKIKLQYRLDIISMLIFIFSGTLVLLM